METGLSSPGKGSTSMELSTSQKPTSRTVRFWTLVAGIIFFFGLHNYMQELIMSLPGFKVCLDMWPILFRCESV